MKRSILPFTAIFAIVMRGGVVAADEPPFPPPPGARPMHERTFITSVPKVIQRDLYESACRFLEGVYPDIEKDWVRHECDKALLKDRYSLGRFLDWPWSPTVRFGSQAVVQVEVDFPCGTISLEARRPPPGVVLDKLKTPLTLQEAEARARETFARVMGDPERVRRYTVDIRTENPSQGTDFFRFVEGANTPQHYVLAALYVNVRRTDGLIECAARPAPGLTPKISYEKVAEMAKAAKTGYHISLQRHCWGGIGTLTWDVCTPPEPGGSNPRDNTWWDAMTGEVVYSQVIHGGTPKKPYKNPKYFIEVNDEVIKRNIDKLIKDRVAELEKKADEQGTEATAPAR